MTDAGTREITVCRHLRPKLDAPPSALSVAVYCAHPGGHARIPSRDELTRFCVRGHHADCPGFEATRLADMFAVEVTT